jgi:hypothetical protein
VGYKKVFTTAVHKVHHASGMISDFAEEAGKGIGDAAGHVYSSVEDHVGDAGKFLGHAVTKTYAAVGDGVEGVMDNVRDRTYALIEGEVEHIVEHARQKIDDEVTKLVPGVVFLACGMVIVAISGVLLSFACVHLLTTIFDLPPWAAYLLLSGILALAGISLVFYGRARLRTQQ